MYQSTKIYPDVLRSIDSATFTGAYQAVGTPFNYPIRILKIINNSDENVSVSWDGIADHDFIPAATFALYDFGTNRGNSSPGLDLPQGIQISVKGSAGTGLVYVVAFAAITPTMTIPS